MTTSIQQSADSTKIFAKQWALYQKLVGLNLMHHREIIQITSRHLAKPLKTGKLDILDLGCGDAHVFANVLKGQPFRSYLGIDLTAAAMAEATKNFAREGLSGKDADRRIRFAQGDIMRFREVTKGQRYGCINSGYSIHHLQSEQKYALFDEIVAALDKGGLFIYVDIFKSRFVSRSRYVESSKKQFTASKGFTAAEKKMIMAHISAYDFPEDVGEALAHFQSAGLSVVTHEPLNPLFRIVVLKK